MMDGVRWAVVGPLNGDNELNEVWQARPTSVNARTPPALWSRAVA